MQVFTLFPEDSRSGGETAEPFRSWEKAIFRHAGNDLEKWRNRGPAWEKTGKTHLPLFMQIHVPAGKDRLFLQDMHSRSAEGKGFRCNQPSDSRKGKGIREGSAARSIRFHRGAGASVILLPRMAVKTDPLNVKIRPPHPPGHASSFKFFQHHIGHFLNEHQKVVLVISAFQGFHQHRNANQILALLLQ